MSVALRRHAWFALDTLKSWVSIGANMGSEPRHSLWTDLKMFCFGTPISISSLHKELSRCKSIGCFVFNPFILLNSHTKNLSPHFSQTPDGHPYGSEYFRYFTPPPLSLDTPRIFCYNNYRKIFKKQNISAFFCIYIGERSRLSCFRRKK